MFYRPEDRVVFFKRSPVRTVPEPNQNENFPTPSARTTWSRASKPVDRRSLDQTARELQSNIRQAIVEHLTVLAVETKTSFSD